MKEYHSIEGLSVRLPAYLCDMFYLNTALLCPTVVMSGLCLSAVLVASLAAAAAQYNNPPCQGNRQPIVHLFEWPWDDIAQECEQFLGPKVHNCTTALSNSQRSASWSIRILNSIFSRMLISLLLSAGILWGSGIPTQ